MRWERIRYGDPAGGTTIAHRLSPAGSPAAVVVLVHGAGNDALFSFARLVKRLLSERVEVFTFDLPGHGRSSSTALDPGTVHEAVPTAVRVSGASERGLPVHLIGVSFGGALALAALGSHPGLFASGVIVAAPLHIRVSASTIAGELGLPLLRALWRERRHAGIWGSIPSFGPVKRGVYPLRLAVAPAEGAFGYVQVLNDVVARLDLSAAAAAVEAPVLLVYGARDRIVPLGQGEELARLIRRSELLRLPTESHLTALSAATEEIAHWISTDRGEAAG